jgi:hypothetical protein
VTEPDVPPESRDRSALIQAFGLVAVVLGLFCLLLMAITVLGGLAPEADFRMMLPGVFLYLGLAAYYLATGMGSVRLRRWARPVVLAVSWIWLVTGVFSLAVTSVFLPKMMEQARPPGIDAEAFSFAQGCTFFFLVIFDLILPGLFVTFYGRPDVRATFERRDPVPRWTDRCPTSVLGLVFVLAYAALAMLLSAVVPIFGAGPVSALVCLGIAALLALLAWSTYNLRPWAWWAVLLLWLLGALSAASFAQQGLDWKQLYGQMGVPADQVAMVEKMGLFEFLRSPEMLGLIAALVLGTLVFLLWVRRYFRGRLPVSGTHDEMP